MTKEKDRKKELLLGKTGKIRVAALRGFEPRFDG